MKNIFLPIEKERGGYTSTDISSNLCLLVLEFAFLPFESEETEVLQTNFPHWI